MKSTICSGRNVVCLSNLPGIKYEIGPYYGCEHRCCYCYALNNAETDWSGEILVHEALAKRLENELADLEPGIVLIGRDTDPYQPIESDIQHTRKALRVLNRFGFPPCILTKSDMVIRDLELLPKEPETSVGVSLSFHDEAVRELFEPMAPSNTARMYALKSVKEAGIDTYALISPIMPFLTDIDALTEMAAAHANTIWFYRLAMDSEKDANWINCASVIKKYFPYLGEEFKKAAFSPKHPYWIELSQKLHAMKENQGLNPKIEF